jgi:hypothetical protein
METITELQAAGEAEQQELQQAAEMLSAAIEQITPVLPEIWRHYLHSENAGLELFGSGLRRNKKTYEGWAYVLRRDGSLARRQYWGSVANELVPAQYRDEPVRVTEFLADAQRQCTERSVTYIATSMIELIEFAARQAAQQKPALAANERIAKLRAAISVLRKGGLQ